MNNRHWLEQQYRNQQLNPLRIVRRRCRYSDIAGVLAGVVLGGVSAAIAIDTCVKHIANWLF